MAVSSFGLSYQHISISFPTLRVYILLVSNRAVIEYEASTFRLTLRFQRG